MEHKRTPSSAITQKDGLYFVMWKLERVSKNELNKGQTTAFKRCNTVSEAKRYKRTLHEFTQIQLKIRGAKDQQEAN